MCKTCDLLVDPSSLSCEIMIKRIIWGIVANEMYQEHRLNEVGYHIRSGYMAGNRSRF